MKNKGLFFERTENNPRELSFAVEWEKENTNCQSIDYGYGTLQNLFIVGNGLHGKLWFPKKELKQITKINKRDRFIVATVIQWLGSNCGMCFLHKALNNCGYTIIKKEEKL